MAANPSEFRIDFSTTARGTPGAQYELARKRWISSTSNRVASLVISYSGSMLEEQSRFRSTNAAHYCNAMARETSRSGGLVGSFAKPGFCAAIRLSESHAESSPTKVLLAITLLSTTQQPHNVMSSRT